MTDLEDLLKTIEAWPLRDQQAERAASPGERSRVGAIHSRPGPADRRPERLTYDPSRVLEEGIYVARPEAWLDFYTVIDGHDYIDAAIDRGARVVVFERAPKTLREGVSYVSVQDAGAALGRLAGAFFGQPSRQLRLVGVTGTNGKTTVATSLYRLFRNLGYRAGLISTISYRIEDRTEPARQTTPDVIVLSRLMREMVDQGCTHCFMEVSSHGIREQRIAGLDFDGAVYTNLTPEHLDYHGTFAAYGETKKAFFDALSPKAFALFNTDDRHHEWMAKDTPARRSTFSVKGPADFTATILRDGFTGLTLEIEGDPLSCLLAGAFNASNLLAVYATAVLLGEEPTSVRAALCCLPPVDGRFERIASPRGVTGVVDFAHTPDAVANVLAAIREARDGTGRTIAVVGCAGNRDASQRPAIAAAYEGSDLLILTSENPRFEDPAAIVEAMKAGLPEEARSSVVTIFDRKAAIIEACTLAEPGDTVVVTGRGHQRYEEVRGERRPSDDKAMLAEALGGPLKAS